MADEPKEPVRAHCPTCDGERVCEVHGHVYKKWDWADNQGNSVSGGVDHSLLECRGCETVFYENSSWNTEDMDHRYDAKGEIESYFPTTKETHPKVESKTKPQWFDSLRKVDQQLHAILSEMYIAYDNHAHILAAVGLRTALDRGTEVLNIDPAITFEEKLTELKEGGWIGETEKDILGVVTDAGSAAAHRGWEPTTHEITQLVYALEVFLQRAFIVGQKALGIKNNIPPKPRRRRRSAKSNGKQAS